MDGNSDTIAHTGIGVGQWWSANFESGETSVAGVSILNRADCCGDRLREAEVLIDGNVCGSLPDTTVEGTWYEI